MQQYDRAHPGFPLRTAGWFYLGFPGLIAFGLGFGYVFRFASRWIGQAAAWSLMLSVSAIVIGLTIRESLPPNVLRAILGEKVASQVTLDSLQSSDSFNDGVSYSGRLKGSPATFRRIIQEKNLVPTDGSLNVIRSWYPEDSLPESGTLYASKTGVFYFCFYFDAKSDSIYFVMRPVLQSAG